MDGRSVGPWAAISIGLAGLLLLGFVGYLLGLSGLSENRTQRAMVKSFTKSLGEATAPVGPTAEKKPVAVLSIPSIGISNQVVVEGTSSRDLMSGPGHLPATALPGQAGTSTIFGKRASFGAPFRSLLKLQAGDTITVTTGQGKSTYRVSSFGDSARPAPANSANRLLLETAGAGWSPKSVVMVSADLTSPVQDSAGVTPATGPNGKPLARDTAESLIPLTGWSQLLLLTAIAGTVLMSRGARWPALLCISAVATAVLWNVYENAAGLLPNLF